MSQLPDKLFFKIGEVAELVGVKAHVLRYWESEFPALRPMKTQGAHRMYRRKDVELAMYIRRLLHDERYTIPGAKRKLRELGQHRRDSPSDPQAVREVRLRAELIGVRDELLELLQQMGSPTENPVHTEPATVTVVQVAQATMPAKA